MEQESYPGYFPLMLMLYPQEQRGFKKVWQQFSTDYQIDEVREKISEVLETCLCSDSNNFQEPNARSNIALFFAQLMALLEAKYVKEAKNSYSEA